MIQLPQVLVISVKDSNLSGDGVQLKGGCGPVALGVKVGDDHAGRWFPKTFALEPPNLA